VPMPTLSVAFAKRTIAPSSVQPFDVPPPVTPDQLLRQSPSLERLSGF